MAPSLLELPFEIREKILYHTFVPVLPRDKSTTSLFPAKKIYPNIQPTEDGETNYPTTLDLSVLRTSHQLLREGELLLYRHLELNLLYRDPKSESRYGGLQSAIMFVGLLNPRHRQLVRYLELRCGEVPSLSEWMYGLYFLEMEFHSLRELRFFCPRGVERGVLESLRGEREWVRKVLRVTLFGGEEEVEEDVVFTE